MTEEKKDEKLTISVTGVCEYLNTPKHYKCFRIDKLREPSPAMLEGTALHLAVFEPEKFETDVYTTMPKTEGQVVLKTVDDLKQFLSDNNEKVTGTKKTLMEAAAGLIKERCLDQVIFYDDFVTSQSHKIKLTEKVYETILRIREAVWEAPFFKRNRGQGEVEKYFKGTIEGVEVRGRLDWMIFNKSMNQYIITDLKKCRSAKFGLARRSIMDMNYDVQGWLYTELVRQNLGKDSVYMWLFAEGALPHICETYSADMAMMEIAELKARWALKEFKKSMKNNHWPGYTNGDVQNMYYDDWVFNSVNNLIKDKEEYKT